MIIEGLVMILTGALSGVLSLLPAMPVDSAPGGGASIDAIIGIGRAFNVALPITETLSMVGVAFGIIGSVYLARVIVFVWKLLPLT